MANPWEPEHPVDRDLAARLVASQFPDLDTAAIARVGQGWDFDVWRVGGIVFRFPRRRFGVECVAIEARVLPELAPRVPLPIPHPTHFGVPAPEFPHPFLGHPYLAGETGDEARLDPAARGLVAAELAAFVRALHAIDLAEARAIGVPRDTFRSDMRGNAERALARLHFLDGSEWAHRVPEIRDRLHEPPADGPRDQRVVAHGDFDARHLLFDADRRIAGVLDWGDVSIGDPAIDLSVAFTFLPPPARPGFWSAYGEVDVATRTRARHLALCRYGVQLLAYALDVGATGLAAEAAMALGNSLAPDS